MNAEQVPISFLGHNLIKQRVGALRFGIQAKSVRVWVKLGTVILSEIRWRTERKKCYTGDAWYIYLTSLFIFLFSASLCWLYKQNSTNLTNLRGMHTNCDLLKNDIVWILSTFRFNLWAVDHTIQARNQLLQRQQCQWNKINRVSS